MKKPGFIYIMGCDESGLLKIGWSLNPHKRLQDIKTANPQVNLLMYFPGEMAFEKGLQRFYRRSCIGGEWFKFSVRRLEQFCRHTVELLAIAAEKCPEGTWINSNLVNGASDQA